MRKIIVILVITSFFFAKANIVWSCSCAGPDSPKEAFENVKAVFIGHVTNLVKDENDYVKNVELRVNKVWKGSVANGDILDVGIDSMCTFWPYENDTSYLIYAYESPHSKNTKHLEISRCSRTKLLKEGQIETRYLDAIAHDNDTSAIDRELPLLLQNGESDEIRAEAAKMLNWFQLRDKESVPEGTVDSLINAVLDPSSKVREEAATALAYSLPRRTEIKTALIGLLEDPDEQVRRNAAWALQMVAPEDTETYQSLVKALRKELSSSQNESENYENTLASLGSSLLKAAGTKEEKSEAITLSLELLDKIDDPYTKVSLIQPMGFLGPISKVAAPKFLSLLKETDQYHLKQYTINALADVEATNAFDDIANFLQDENCYVIQSTIKALKKLDPDRFKQYFPSEVKQVIESKFDQCRYEFINMLQSMDEEAKNLEPLLFKKYQAMSGTQQYEKDAMKQLLDQIKN
jgi:HEAT repeat protein